jgi:hypothetical protein
MRVWLLAAISPKVSAMIPSPLTAAEVLEREFLNIRARILEVGALLDRLERAEGDVRLDPRCQRIERALDVLSQQDAPRAEQIQMIFSLPYEEDWQEQFDREGWRREGKTAVKPK